MSGNTEVLNKANHVLGPIQGATFANNATSSAAGTDLSAYKGQWVTFTADGGAIYIMEAATLNAAKTLDDTARSTNDVAPSGTTQCKLLPNGVPMGFVISVSAPFIGFKTATGVSAVLRYEISSNKHGSEA